jgi:hypothetical protein
VSTARATDVIVRRAEPAEYVAIGEWLWSYVLTF